VENVINYKWKVPPEIHLREDERCRGRVVSDGHLWLAEPTP
jgi:hypothetical protein